MKSKWKLIEHGGVTSYKCGLVVGDKLRLKQDIQVRDHKDKLTGITYSEGEIWTVLSGAVEENPVLWLRQSDGKRHTWSDDASVFDWFEKI